MKDLRWKLLNQKVLIKDQWINLRANTYQMPDGHIVTPYYILNYPHWINVTAITEQDEVVMIRQYRPGRDEVAWELPGGMMDEGEDSLGTARRELLEETGYTADRFVEVARTSVNPASHTNLSITILATGAHYVAAPQLEASEDIEVRLMPLEEVMTLLRRNKISQMMDVASLFYVREWLGEA